VSTRTVTVTNPDTQSATLASAFTVSQLPAPAVTGVSPSSAIQGQALAVILTGSNFQNGATCSFGSAGIAVNSCVFNSATQLTANITLASNATVSTRTVTVTNPDTQSATLASAFTVSQLPAPAVTGVSPSSGIQGQALAVIITGSNFQNAATCSFGSAGVTVNSCVFNSATQLTANITLASNATVSTRTVTVINPDSQSAALPSAFVVNQAPPPPPPTLTSISPNSGQQAQTLLVTLTGTNFLYGATCSFGGAGVTVNTCAVNSTTQVTANITITANAAIGAGSVTITNPDTQSATLANAFTVNTVPGLTHIDFTYPDRTSLLNAGWSYIATTSTGATRNTEQSGALAVSYDQAAHPGTIRVPLGSGDDWQNLNNSQNTLFYTPPADWTSLRVKINSFSPAANYQEVALQAYQNDDNYVDADRSFIGSPQIEMYREVARVTTSMSSAALTNTGNLILRLDRTGNTYAGFYSANGGTTWVSLGSTTMTLSNPKLAIMIGANDAGTTPVADLAWVEIYRPGPAPSISSANPNSGTRGQALAVIITGSNFQSGATCSFGSAGITVTSCVFNSATQLTANITLASNATVSTRTVTVTNPDTQSATLASAFTVN
jgi:hypothetical protein